VEETITQARGTARRSISKHVTYILPRPERSRQVKITDEFNTEVMAKVIGLAGLSPGNEPRA